MRQIISSVIILTLLIFTIALQAQFIKGTIVDNPADKVYLYEIVFGKPALIDSAEVRADDSFVFTTTDSLPAGMYQISAPGMQSVDIIVNGYPVIFHTHAWAVTDSMVVKSSLDTRLFYQVISEEREFQKKNSALSQLIRLYVDEPEKREFRRLLQSESDSLGRVRMQRQQHLAETHPNSFMAVLLQNSWRPAFTQDDRTRYEDENAFLRDHYFDNLNLNQPMLLRSNILPNKINDYITLFNAKSDQTFIAAIDRIALKMSENKRIHQYTLEYLLQSFAETDYDDVFFYISSLYEAEHGCLNENLDFDLETEKRIRQNLQPGKTAPEIRLENPDGQLVSLHDVDADYTLVIFWASWCSHCVNALPEIDRLYKTYKEEGLNVYAVSLDREKLEWISTIESQAPDWIHVSELQGWEGDYNTTYHIRGTPTYYLLDDDKKIIAKPGSVDQIEAKLQAVLESTFQSESGG